MNNVQIKKVLEKCGFQYNPKLKVWFKEQVPQTGYYNPVIEIRLADDDSMRIFINEVTIWTAHELTRLAKTLEEV